MENATKALLIAGSVLIAILLIAVGMRIFNSAQGSTDAAKVTMDATAIASFNNQFAGFLNKNITAAKCSTLIQKILASNATNSTHKITFNGSEPNGTETPTAGKYIATYTNGYITGISISP